MPCGAPGELRPGVKVQRGEAVHRRVDGVDLTPTAAGTEVRWHATFEAPPGFGWIYVVALRRFTGRLLQGLSERLRAPTTTGR